MSSLALCEHGNLLYSLIFINRASCKINHEKMVNKKMLQSCNYELYMYVYINGETF
jgi:hypothetical protein